jgi:hypothetical protein
MIDVSIGAFFKLRDNGATRGHRYKLYSTYSRIIVRKYFFSQRIVNIWSNLNPNIINFTSLTAFINRVCSFSSCIFTIGGASALVAQEVVCTALYTRSLVRL